MKARKAKYYRINIYKKTMMKEWHLEETKIIYNKFKAIGYGITEEEKGNKVLIEAVTEIYHT